MSSPDRRREERRNQAVNVSTDRRGQDRRTQDRRQSARVPLDLWVEEEKGNELYFRRTGNVSAGGIWFEQTIPHTLGTKVRLRFSLPSGEMIEAQAEIVNTPQSKDGLGMGLQFLEMTASAREALDRYLSEAS